jgi:AraC-like DNA-binding protein
MHHSPLPLLPPRADGGLTRLAVASLREAKIDPAPLLLRAGLTAAQIDDADARIEVSGQVEFLRLAAEVLDDEMLGFRLSQTFELRQIGLLYFVIASSPTMQEALGRAERYSIITNEGVLLRFVRNGAVAIEYEYVGVPRHTDRHQMEFWMAALVRMARQVTGSTLRPISVQAMHHRCAESNQLEAFLGCEVAFGADRDVVAFAPEVADIRLVGADPYLHDLLVRFCEEALAHRRRPAEALQTRVENAISPLLPHGKARAADVARALGLSQRTFARRLAAEGLTFAGILDDLRADLAQLYLSNPSLSVSEIAWLLGFKEVSAFTHAFRRWTGQTPTQARLDRRQAEVGRETWDVGL